MSLFMYVVACFFYWWLMYVFMYDVVCFGWLMPDVCVQVC